MSEDCIVRQVGLGTLIVVTLLSLLRCVCMIAPHCFPSDRFERKPRGSRWWLVYRRVAFLQYCLLVPLFELLITWGARVDPVFAPVSAEVELAWLAVLVMSCFALVVAFVTRSSYSMTAHTVQIMQLPCATTFLCERIVNGHAGGEIAVIVAIMLCSLFEICTLPDFFSVFGVATRRNGLRDRSPHSRSSSAGVSGGEEIILRSTNYADERSEDGAAMQSTELADNASRQALANLFELLATAEPARMSQTELRAFVSKCKKKVEMASQSSETHSGPPPDVRMTSRGSAIYPTPAATTMHATSATGQYSSEGVRARYSKEVPEC